MLLLCQHQWEDEKGQGCSSTGGSVLPPRGVGAAWVRRGRRQQQQPEQMVLYFISRIKRNREAGFLRRGAFISLHSV